MLYNPPKVIFVDVDGTLLHPSGLNTNLVEWLKEKKTGGYTINLWSSRGEQHARKVAEKFNLLDLFNHILSKPGYIADNLGWNWIKYTKVIPNYYSNKMLMDEV